jgi:hypothetical protein
MRSAPRGLLIIAVFVSCAMVTTAAQRAPARQPPPRVGVRTPPGPVAAPPRPVPGSPRTVAPEAAPPGKATPTAVSPRNANYSIDAELDTGRRTLTGREVITWRNITPASTDEIRLHLYYNAWRNTQSTWLRERQLAGRAGDFADLPEQDWASIDVTAIRLLGAGAAPPIDLTAAARFIAPDDGNPDDRTLLSVPLPSIAGPGSTINLAVEWTLHVPRTFARTGALDDFFFLAQWFPKVAVLQAHGWTSHQFHATTEFFSDYGTYDVRLTVPRGWTVGATGVAQPAQSTREGATTHRFIQDDVHDFAWTTSPKFLDLHERFDDPRLPPVDMRLLLQPEHAGQAERHFAAARATLKYYGDWFGPYPYGHLTIVDPAWQSDADGMEYPTLITAGTRWLAPSGVAEPEDVVVHEAGHQWWYGLVGSNEFDYALLDEGFNTFATARTLDVAYPPFVRSDRFFGGFIPWVYRDVPMPREVDGDRLNGYRLNAKSDVPSTPSWKYYPRSGGSITYNKTAVWLHTLERMLGWPTLQRILSTYFERYRFKHPTPEDFFAVANEVSGQDLTWFFDQVYRTANVFDYGIQNVTSDPVTVTGYVDDASGQRRFVRDQKRDDLYRTNVIARRYGEALFPVDVLVTFEDGTQLREHWDGRARWTRYTYERASRAVSAQVDPDRILLLDVNYTNNSFTLKPSADRAATKWSLAWLVWLQDLLVTSAFFS